MTMVLNQESINKIFSFLIGQYKEKNCFAMGWGKERFDSPSYQQILRDVEMPMVPNDVCQEKLRKAGLGKGFNLHKSFNCAGYVYKIIKFSTKSIICFLVKKT